MHHQVTKYSPCGPPGYVIGFWENQGSGTAEIKEAGMWPLGKTACKELMSKNWIKHAEWNSQKFIKSTDPHFTFYYRCKDGSAIQCYEF